MAVWFNAPIAGDCYDCQETVCACPLALLIGLVFGASASIDTCPTPYCLCQTACDPVGAFTIYVKVDVNVGGIATFDFYVDSTLFLTTGALFAGTYYYNFPVAAGFTTACAKAYDLGVSTVYSFEITSAYAP